MTNQSDAKAQNFNFDFRANSLHFTILFSTNEIIKSNSQRVRGEGEKTRKNTQRFLLCSYENSIIASSSSLFRHKQLHFTASRYFRLKFIFFISNNQQERKIRHAQWVRKQFCWKECQGGPGEDEEIISRLTKKYADYLQSSWDRWGETSFFGIETFVKDKQNINP